MVYHQRYREGSGQILTESTDTIVAIATPPGRGGVGIIRLSGPQAPDIARGIFARLPLPRQAAFRRFMDADGIPIDEGIALYFPGPGSFTGEEIVELQGHGGPVVMDLLLQRCLQLGARVAEPGEFSLRAFLNDRLDLAQAEAIADLIDSGSDSAARSAMRSLQGQFSKEIDQLVEALIHLRMHVEAALDFPEEEIDFLADDSIHRQLENITKHLASVQSRAKQGSLLREGMHLVIAGQPNAGKSSLLNQLAGRDSAIVTHLPGTTRDVLREHIQLDGMPLHVFDTAGLRDSEDLVEQEGIRRTWVEIERADALILMIDGESGFSSKDDDILSKLPQSLPVLQIYNKCDLTGHAPGWQNDKLYISAQTGDGLDELKTELKQRMGYQAGAEDVFIARRRHLQALAEASDSVAAAKEQLTVFNAGELMAEELRRAQDTLGLITGKFTADDLLGEIFSSFCIGK